MSTSNVGQVLSKPVDADYSTASTHLHRMFKLNSDGEMTAITATTDNGVGVLQNSPVTIQAAAIAISGVTKIQIATLCTSGNNASMNTSGQMIPSASGSKDIGIIWTGGAAGTKGELLLNPMPLLA